MIEEYSFDFERLLNNLFPWGYTGDIKNWRSDYFLGWCHILEESKYEDIMSVNVDGDDIVFWLVRSEPKPQYVTGFIDGIMRVVFPEMVCDEYFTENSHVISYHFKEDVKSRNLCIH